MKEKPGKFIAFFNLVEAMAKPGCPVCGRLLEDVHHAMDSFLYESVNDPELRSRIRRYGGFCPRHSWQLAAFGDALGGAILFKDVLENAVASLDGARQHPRSRHPRAGDCIFCESERRSHDGLVATIVTHFKDEELVAAWEGPAVLCLKHLSDVCSRLTDAEDRRQLIASHRVRYQKLCTEMSSLCEKQSHDHRAEPLSADERQSWLRAIEMLVGKPGVP